MPKVTLPIANGFYVSESKPISAQRCVGLYPNLPQDPALSQETLLGIPGLNQLTTTGTDGANRCRGMHVKNDVAYAVNGAELVSVDRSAGPPESFSTASLGAVVDAGQCSMAENGTQLMVVTDSGTGYIYNEDAGTPFQTITDTDFTTTNGTPQKCVFIDGYFLVTTNEKKFKLSSLNDGLTWSALDFGSAEADPDAVVAPHVLQNQLYIFGTETFERFQNIGGAGFPFQRVSGAVIDKGLHARFGITNINNTMVWIGGGANEGSAIWQSNGGLPQKISTTAIDNAIQEYTAEQISDVFAWSYAERGAYFVGFSFPNTCFVYDMTSGRWHERQSLISGQTLPYRVHAMVRAYGRMLVGDSFDGRIGEMCDMRSEYGENILRSFSTQPFANQGNPVFVSDVELTIESGVGNSEDPDPVIRMDYSDDGKTFTTPRSRSMGKVGEYFRRCIWRRLGRIPRFRVFRFMMTDKVTSNVIKMEADLSG